MGRAYPKNDKPTQKKFSTWIWKQYSSHDILGMEFYTTVDFRIVPGLASARLDTTYSEHE